MSETDDLKKGAEDSKIRQTYQAINDYMDSLMEKITEAKKKRKVSSVIYHIAWLVWMVTLFFSDTVTYYGLLLFTFALMYDSFRFTKETNAYSEFLGAIKILEILGYIPPRPPNGEKKKRKIFSEFRDMVKGWAIKKKEAQDKVFAPA